MTVTPFRAGRPSWWPLLDLTKAGVPRAEYRNAIIALRNDHATSGAFGYDEMMQMPMLMHEIGAPLDSGRCPRPLTDTDARNTQEWVQEIGLFSMSFDSVYAAIDVLARENPHHPLKDYLKTVEDGWDGEQRLDVLLARYFGAEPKDYHSEIGEKFFMSMVARILYPGCKCDYMPVLEAMQGSFKSTALRIIASNRFFSDNLPDISGNAKDASLHLRGKWVIEIPEMHVFTKAESTLLKSFITRQEERFRPPYGRADVIEPRQCVFAGTTNKDLYLKDETGGRRFWPVKCGVTGPININLLEADRDQLFGEAVYLVKQGLDWHPNPDFEREFIVPEQQARYDGDTWEDLIREWADGKVGPHTIKDIAIGCLGYEEPGAFSGSSAKPYTQLGTADQNRIKRALAAIGWERVGRNSQGTTLFGPRRK